MSKRKLAITFAALGLIGASGAVRAESASARVVEDLTRAVETRTDLAPEKLAEARQILAQRSGDAAAVAKVLRLLYPDFDRQCRELTKGNEEAFEALEGMVNHEDPYLAAEAAYTLGRAYLGRENYEAAVNHFEPVNTRLARHTLRAGESLYYQGLGQAGALRGEDAIDSLLAFIGFHGDASPALLAAARREVTRLEERSTGDLNDVARHMDYAGSKLAHVDAGADTQEVQGRIVDMLDELIRIAEQPPT